MTDILTVAAFYGYLTACAHQYPLISAAPSQRTLAHAIAESSLSTTALHDNSTGKSYTPATQTEAITLARDLLAAGHKIDAGVMQVDSANWPAYSLTVETAFDPRVNICAGARILGEAFQIERRAACRYNTGHPECSNGYPEAIDRIESGDPRRGFANGYVRQVLARAPTQSAMARVPPAEVAAPPPSTPACAPAWDPWALASCSSRKPRTTIAAQPQQSNTETASR